ncbi:MAG: MCE family protein [Planctomycetes bacterium]|nr:MCE family protein [Planctomycetota bacterium]
MTKSSPAKETAFPKAVLIPNRRFSVVWLIPIAAAVFAVWLGYQAWLSRGLIITVQLSQGYGIKAGDEVRYRGITVGEVRNVELDDSDSVIVTASLQAQADRIAKSGSRFWVVRPQLGLEGIAGLETILGPRYLAVSPGQGGLQRHFVGLSKPPVIESSQVGDLEIILQASERGGLKRGAAIKYRGLQIGNVLSVGLASDGGAVEARVHIEKAYAQLVRKRTQFWSIGSLKADIKLTGVSLEVDSLATLLSGGIAMATPPDAGDVVSTGYRFPIANEPPEDWITWQPLVVIGSSLLPPGAALPTPMRARLGWQQGRWITRTKSRQGWVLQTTIGLLGPEDLLKAGEDADEQSVVLEVAGTNITLKAQPKWSKNNLVIIDSIVSSTSWPVNQIRKPLSPEDCLAVGDPTATPLPLAASRLTPQKETWRVDPAVSVDKSWHGAAVVARKDGFLVGLLIVDDDVVSVVLIDESINK